MCHRKGKQSCAKTKEMAIWYIERSKERLTESDREKKIWRGRKVETDGERNRDRYRKRD